MARTNKKKNKNTVKRKLTSLLGTTRGKLILFVILFGLMGGIYVFRSSAAICACGTTGVSETTKRNRIIYVAGLQKGQTEFNSSVLTYSDGNREAWCADFVSWVYKTAGYPFTNGLSGGWRWRRASASGDYSLKDYVTYIGKYKPKSSYTPRPGDIIFFNPAYYSHVGVVISVSGGRVYTVEGNIRNINPSLPANQANGGKVDSDSHALSDVTILGYGDMF